MTAIQRFELTKSGNDYTLIVYIDPQRTEFAQELGQLTDEKEDLSQRIAKIVKSKFPHLKINYVRVMAGALLVSSLFIGNVVTTAAATPTSEGTTTQVQTESQPYDIYTVKKGDSLSLIAKNANISVDSIKTLNNLTSDRIVVGQQLQMPFTTHTVISGDNLFRLAQRYDSSVDAIKSINNLKTNTLSIGQRLQIPLKVNEQTAITQNTTPEVTKTEPIEEPSVANTPEVETTAYTVVAGDSLSAIAKKFNTSVTEIKELNNLTSDRIVVGQNLKLPQQQQLDPTLTEEVAAEPAAPVETPMEIATSTYTVVAGDSLSVIAKRFNTTVTELKDLNNLTTDRIVIGQTLNVPKQETTPTTTPEPTEEEVNIETEQPAAPVESVEEVPITYTVVAGDSLSVIAKKFQTTVTEIKEVNNLPSDRIFVGQTLLLSTPVQETAEPIQEIITPAKPTIGSLHPVNQDNQGTYSVSGMADPATTITISIRDAGNGLVTEKVETDETGFFEATMSLATLQDGNLTITANALHKSGGESERTETIIQKDTTIDVPEVRIADIVNQENESAFSISGTAKKNATVFVTVTDTTGIETTTEALVQDDGTYEVVLDVSNFADSTLTFRVFQHDTVGNKSSVNIRYIDKDTTAPDTPTIDHEAYITTENETAYVINGNGEANATVKLLIFEHDEVIKEQSGTTDEDGNFSIPINFSDLRDGEIRVAAVLYDKANNSSEQTVSTLIKNTEIPEIVSTASFETISTSNETDYMIAGTATPDSIIRIQVTDGSTTINRTASTDEQGNFTLPINVSSLNDGDIEISLQASSSFGNKGENDTHTVVKDTTAPDNIQLDMNDYVNQHNTNHFPISGITGEARIHVLLRITDGEETITSDAIAENGHFRVTVDLSMLKDGPLTMEVTQVDEAGNQSETETILFEKDTQISNPTLNRSGYAIVGDTIVYNVVGVAEALGTITIDVINENGEVVKQIQHTMNPTGVFNLDIDLKDLPENEDYSFIVTQSDHAGNYSESIAPTALTHTVQSGENLSLIAKQYNTTVEAIKRVNRLEGDIIYVNQLLQLPVTANTTLNLGYMYFGDVKTFTNQVLRTERAFNVVAPSYFDLNKDGSLQLTYLVDATFVENMHHQGIRVVPFLSNHWDREIGRAMLANYEQTAQQIADAVMKYNLDGVNVDIENITHEDRDKFTAFVKLLRELLPASKEVSVAVAANPYGWEQGWHGAYDYNALSQHADYLMMMTYDESYQGSDPGPVASLPWVEKSIQYALSQGVEADKIVFGLAHYGRYWVEGQAVGGNGISNSQVKDMLDKYEHTITFDEESQSAKAVVTIKEDDPHMYILGKALPEGTYTIWYENEQSYQAKLALVDQYGIRGVGHWSIGQEDTSIWNAYPTWYTTKDKVIEVSNIGEMEGNNEETIQEEQATYNNYTVVSGDSLYRIALKNNVTIDQIREANNLTSDMIYIGQVLKIPIV
ncbi:LysM peptidoglycan-binding domain-containing protein [Oceanobacillus halotolerans]|uniref:LysM peptidoglycan-binding domain-containing protein n=1 Tax=Oceanobacillus halotolerans TaxID=2663380 RepID=UPI00299DB908|nr:LysM peptidoglycan-binding domain-containing protein [Oceanobacillus halotolerans]